MAKELKFDNDMQEGLLSGIQKVARAVGSTLGPGGRTVVIQPYHGAPIVTKDGISVAESITLEDPLENMGAQLIRDIAGKTNDVAGDGTTTSTVLAEALVEEGLKRTDKGVNPISLRKGMSLAVEDALKCLEEDAKTITSKEEIAQVASISANDDTEIGNIIADAIEKVGNDGVITVEESKTTETFIDFVEGMELDRGYSSIYYVNDKENMSVKFDNPYVLLYDGSISSTDEIYPILEATNKNQRPLLIIAEDVSGEAYQTIVSNVLNGVLKCAVIKSPGFGDRKKLIMEDIAILTGGTFISEERGISLYSATLKDLGQAGCVRITSSTTKIVDGLGSEEEIEERANEIRRDIEQSSSDYERERNQERLAKLIGGVAVINVGATTEIELKEKKHRVEDSLNATRAAIREGIVPGGGTELCQISTRIGIKNDNPDVEVGYNIVRKALERPIRKIADNAGFDASVVCDAVKKNDKGVGFNALDGNMKCSMIEEGIIDPVLVTKSALKNASSIASLVLTSSASVTIIPEKKMVQANGNDMMGMY